jgi:hypothetical protein
MALFDVVQNWNAIRRAPVDDAYTEWFNSHSRCSEALRAWQAAEPEARAFAYRRYLAELDQEEAAAAELARLHGLRLAA